MTERETPSFEQKRYVASVCPEFHPRNEGFLSNTIDVGDVTCDACIHWNDGECGIFDEVLTGIDQT
ncbi:MAG: hypothetical protein GX352_06185 [Clostridiales bacterium]|nr:hypothetical protein [Clostridiales bacterium]